jgi:hypothetical protein
MSSRPALGPSQPSIQWVPGVKAAGAWSWSLTSSLCRSQENGDLYIQSPIRLHGVLLNYLSTGTTLPYSGLKYILALQVLSIKAAVLSNCCLSADQVLLWLVLMSLPGVLLLCHQGAFPHGGILCKEYMKYTHRWKIRKKNRLKQNGMSHYFRKGGPTLGHGWFR